MEGSHGYSDEEYRGGVIPPPSKIIDVIKNNVERAQNDDGVNGISTRDKRFAELASNHQ